MTTYAEARAACVVRWGTPTDEWFVNGLEFCEWQRVPGVAFCGGVCLGFDGSWMMLCAKAMWVIGAETGEWTLVGEPTAEVPLTPLCDAIDAAERWMAGRSAPMPGPVAEDDERTTTSTEGR